MTGTAGLELLQGGKTGTKPPGRARPSAGITGVRVGEGTPGDASRTRGRQPEHPAQRSRFVLGGLAGELGNSSTYLLGRGPGDGAKLSQSSPGKSPLLAVPLCKRSSLRHTSCLTYSRGYFTWLQPQLYCNINLAITH